MDHPLLHPGWYITVLQHMYLVSYKRIEVMYCILTALHASISVPGLLVHGQSPWCMSAGASVSCTTKPYRYL